MRLHHIGIVVDNIVEKAALYCRIVPIGLPAAIIHDEIQQVRVAFADAGDGIAIEFIEPDGENSTVASALRRNISLHHICYEVQNLEQAIAQARAAGALVVCEPVPAQAFEGRRIAFIYSPVGGLTEFVEATKQIQEG